MKGQSDPYTSQSQNILSAWQEGVAGTARSPLLLREIQRRERELFSHFVEQYNRLRTLPRRMRRSLQKKWRHTLAGVALLMALGGGPAVAATINVDDTTCTLVDAITTANTDTNTGGCVLFGVPRADTIVLPIGSTQTLTEANSDL